MISWLFLFSFLSFVNSSKKICFTTSSYSSCYGSTDISITNVDDTIDISSKIQENLEESDNEVTISLSSGYGSAYEYNFPLNIFNNKKVNIEFSSSSGKFDISNIQNIDLNLQGDSYSSNVNFQYEGTSLTADDSSIALSNIVLTTSINEIQLKNFSYQKSTFTFTKINVNSLNCQVEQNTEVTINDNSAQIDGVSYLFTGYNQNLSITLTSRYNLVFNNQATSSSISYFCFKSIQLIIFNGNDFLDSCSISLTECSQIISNIGLLPISSLTLNSYPNNIEINATKSLSIKGITTISSSANIFFGTFDDCSSRVSISVDSIALSSGKIQLKSSWIDLTVGSFTFSSSDMPIYPCIGKGGSSVSVFNQVTYSSSSSLSFTSLTINLDVTGTQTDEPLATLMSKEWNAITFKSFTQPTAVDKFNSIKYNPSDIYGFKDGSNILNAKSTVTNDYIVTLTASSYTTIPLLLCYTDSSSCYYGNVINDLSQLSDVIPAAQKMVNLTVSKSGAEIDLSSLKTTNSIFTITCSSGYPSYYISSIKMNELSENSNIGNLILNSVCFNTGSFQLYANEITISSASLSSSSQPTISFNEKSALTIDTSSLSSLSTYITDTFPKTTVNAKSSSYSSLGITDTEFTLSGYGSTKFPKDKLSNVILQIGVSTSSTFSFPITTSTSSIGSITVEFSPTSSYYESAKVQVTFNSLDTVVSAEKICIDFCTFTDPVIDLNNFPIKSYFEFIGNNVQIINQGISSGSNLCACKELPCSECSDDLTPVTFDQLNQKIQEIAEEKIQITIIGASDGSSPLFSLSVLGDKDATIIGAGTNPKIQTDCSTSFNSEEKSIEFTKITITAQSTTSKNLQISNLNIFSDCIVDTTFNEISLNINSLICDVSHLVFKEISVQQSFILSGDPSNSQSSTKVTFASSSAFELSLPSTATFSGSTLVFSNLQFDLSNTNPTFTIAQGVTDFNIVGVDGNLESIGSDITIPKSSSLGSLHISGTWQNENPSKFFVFNDFQSNLFLQSINTPLSIEFTSVKNIVLEKEAVGIAGKMSFSGYSISNFQISSTVTGKSTIYIQEISTSSSANLEFASSLIDMKVNTITSGSFKFFMKISLEDQNKVEIINKIDKTFDYEITCSVSGSLKDEKVKEFIDKNHTLIVVNNENTIQTPSSSNLKFEDSPAGFNNDNFKLIVNDNTLVFYTYNSPFTAEVSLYYGYCFICTGTEITKEDLARIEDFIPGDDASLLITFNSQLPTDTIIDFNKEEIKSLNLKLVKSSSLTALDIQIKFGTSISSLDVDGVTLKISEDDSFTISKAVFKDSKFSQPENYANINSLTVSLSSFYTLGITEFANELNINFDSSSYSLNYTKAGVRIVPGPYSYQSPLEIDVSKFINVNMIISSSVVINLEEDVTELKQINSLTFNYDQILIGSNWNKLTASTKVKYSIMNQEKEITVVTNSFPFESWDLMYEYPIEFDSSLSPYQFTDTLTLNNKNLILKTSSNGYSGYTITLNDIIMYGDSTITCIELYNGKLIIDKVTIQKGNSKIENAQISNELILKAGSTINGMFSIGDNFATLNVEWNLNDISLFNPSTLQNVTPQTINIKYVGDSITGKEKNFDDFLSNGIVILKNIGTDIIDKIHFTSENENLFKDGESLALKCQVINDNEIQLISTRKFANPDDIITPDLETSTSSTSNTEEITASDIPSIFSSDFISETPGIINPTPIPYAPTVDNSLTSKGNSIEFTEDGYRDNDNFVSTKDNDKEILLIQSDKKELAVSTSTVGKPNSALFVSPKEKDMIITISPPSDGSDNYGSGQFGVHANSNDPTINLPQHKVPLNLFNNEDSTININLLNNEKTKLLDETQISLSKLILSGGNLQMNIPEQSNGIEFENVETYLNNEFNALNGQEKIEIKIGSLTLNPTSTVKGSKVVFNEEIKTSAKSRIEITNKAKFSCNTVIEMSDSSFIEFGQSEIEGVCKEIKIKREKSSNSLNDEIDVKLICGAKFDCSAWLQKYEEDNFNKYAKCIQENNEICLVATNKKQELQENENKKSFPMAAIIGIIIGVVVIIIIIVIVVVLLHKKKSYNRVEDITGMTGEDDTLDL